MTPHDSSPVARPLGLVVRYWARNMTYVHDQGSGWLGFGYDLSEQAALRAIARRVPFFEFAVWMAFTVLFTLLALAGLTLLGMALLAHMSGGSLDAVSASAFTVMTGVQITVGLAVGFPAAMLLASLITGRLNDVTDADLPDAAVCRHYVHKMTFQFWRMALLLGAVVVAAVLWLPDRVWLLSRCVVPFLLPAISIASWIYYAVRPRTEDPGAVTDASDAPSSHP